MSINERTYAWARPLSTRRGAPKGIIVHHAAASIASAETIHRWHLNNGWSGIGYHFVIRKTGLIERGRPESATGSHATGANDRLGICLEGDFTRETLGKPQRDALVWLLRDLTSRYGALPITGHREHGSTACPGSIPLAAIVTEARTSAPKEEVAPMERYWIKLIICAGTPVVCHADDDKSVRIEEEAERRGYIDPFGRIPTTQESHRHINPRGAKTSSQASRDFAAWCGRALQVKAVPNGSCGCVSDPALSAKYDALVKAAREAVDKLEDAL